MMTGSMLHQLLAAFAVHIVWQVPLLAGAACVALRVGRPGVRTAQAVWVVTLFLSVVAPMAATWQGYRHAVAAAKAEAFITYGGSDASLAITPLRREPAWLRLLQHHVSPTGAVTPFTWNMSPALARCIAFCYVTLLLIACVRFVRALRQSHALIGSASLEVPETITSALDARADAMRCAVPRVCICDAVAGPLLAGIIEPTLLLPPAVLRMSGDDLDAILAHELSHIRRRDPMWHALCSVWMLPVQFHPAAMWIASRIRQTREMACDADAARQMRSASAYAHALLHIAERLAPISADAAGLGLFDGLRLPASPIRDAGAYLSHQRNPQALQLFGAESALEERMQTLVRQPSSTPVARRAIRGMAAAAIAVAGVAAACMVQVQPALAAQRAAEAKRVASQLQLGDPSQEIGGAEENAMTGEDRNRIATGRQAVGMAQSEPAARSVPQTHQGEFAPGVKPDDFQIRPEGLDALKIDTNQEQLEGRMSALTTQLAASTAEMQKRLNSPEFQARLKKQQADAEHLSRRFNSPEFRLKLERQTADAEAMRRKVESPEFKARIQKGIDEAARVNSPEFRMQLQRQMDQAQRDMAQAARNMTLMAKNDAPFTMATPSADQPQRVSSSVMAGSVLTKAVPVYPPSAKQAHISGEVVLHVIVDETGKVEQVSAIRSPDDALTASAMDAVKQWTYKPYLSHGKPTAVDTTVTVHYSFGG